MSCLLNFYFYIKSREPFSGILTASTEWPKQTNKKLSQYIADVYRCHTVLVAFGCVCDLGFVEPWKPIVFFLLFIYAMFAVLDD